MAADAVYRAADDPNDITVTHDFATMDAARAFAGSAELQAAMRDAGVLGASMVRSNRAWAARRLRPVAGHDGGAGVQR